MKKVSLILAAIALVLGMSQCKKEKVEQPAPVEEILGNPVNITVKVDGGGKHDVFTTTGAYVFSNGDYLYVGNGNKYVGRLEYNDGAFQGTIQPNSTEDYLHLYFLGGKAPATTPSIGETTSFEIDIADQSGKLPVLSYGRSTEKFSGPKSYYCILLNQCALVKFTLAYGTDKTVIVGGMKTKATISFNDTENAISPVSSSNGFITLNSKSVTEKWAILLKQPEVLGAPAVIMSNSYNINVPEINVNDYITSGIAINTPKPVFSVSSTETVYFSRGNLQYLQNEWRFANKQWEYTQTGFNHLVYPRDLFSWGAWGSGQNPLYSSTNSSDFKWVSDFQGTLEGRNDWYTLSKDEWEYLLNTRSNSTVNGTSNARHTTATIQTDNNKTIHGIILFPDSYHGGTPDGVTWGDINPTPSPSPSSLNRTVCTEAGWNALESVGCVFLPTTGRYNGNIFSDNPSSYGHYWTRTPDNTNTDRAHCISFRLGNPVGFKSDYRYAKLGVRLVCPAN